MRARLLLLTLVFFATPLFAKEVFLAVSGTANNVFFSDARVFNPNDKDITIQAYYLPRGNGNNSGETATSFTVTKRNMKIFDDIVATLFHRGDVGAIRFVSADDFVVTQRVYAAADCDPSPTVNSPCTLGQFVQGFDLTAAIKNGVLLQLKKNDKFRTNIGAANPNNATAKVTWRLYDKNNALVATSSSPVEMPPYGVIGPTAIDSSFFYEVGTVDLSDAWVSFTSDQPIFAYGSVVDNVSTDQTYVPASADSGTTPVTPTVKTATIVAQDFSFTVGGLSGLKKDDKVTFHVSKLNGTHGFALTDPNGNNLINLLSLTEAGVDRTVTLTAQGTYFFFCTNSNCSEGGPGHFSMTGSFDVGQASPPGPPDGY